MITSIEITNLRGIQQGKLDGLTPLTILVGPNGSGKSTILDALYLVSAGQNETIGGGFGGGLSASGQTEVSSLARILERNKSVAERRNWLHWKGKIAFNIGVIAETTQGKRNVSIKNDLGTFTPVKPLSSVALIEPSTNKAQPLYTLFTLAAQNGLRKEVREILTKVIPNADDIEILTEGHEPALWVVYPDHAVPLALGGSGVHALARLSLELASVAGGVALIEEPEVHQHLMAMGQSAKAIWAAVRRGTQVILSTHSVELIDMLLSEILSDAELAQMSVYRTSLREGCLRSVRIAGEDIAFRRVEIGDDLR